MVRRMPVVFFSLLFSLGGCSQDYSLDPPADSEKVTVTVKLPKELKTETMWVMYRSSKCKHVSRGASGQRVEQDDHQSVYKELERQGQTDLYQVELLKNGGGSGNWHLANVTLGVTYANPTAFGENVTVGAGGGVVVIFDNNNSPRGGANIKVDGDINIIKDYYPWIKEAFIGGYRKRIGLASDGDAFLKYQGLSARRVYFEPVFHSGHIVRSEDPKVHNSGEYIKFTYPDGSFTANGPWQPDFLKLQTIRTGRARDCFIPQLYAKCPDRRPQLSPDWLPDPEKPGYGRYLIVDEWGRTLPLYNYRLVGQNKQVILNRTDALGFTPLMPESVHPLISVEFPERTFAFP